MYLSIIIIFQAYLFICAIINSMIPTTNQTHTTQRMKNDHDIIVCVSINQFRNLESDSLDE